MVNTKFTMNSSEAPPSYRNLEESPPHEMKQIITQPMPQPQFGMTPMPQQEFGMMSMPGCPPALAYLSQIDQVLIHQQVELLEVFTGFETNNKYVLKNSLGQPIFFACEDTDCCTRNCCGPIRPFDMKILDNYQQEIIHLYRPFACSSCCFPCCLQTLEVSSPPGNVIGTIAQEWSIFFPTFAVKNAQMETVMRIEGPFCKVSCCNDVVFRVTSADGSQELGQISKQWTGLVREAFTDADHFGITFPMDLTPELKAVLLGAVFLIDFMYFEVQK